LLSRIRSERVSDGSNGNVERTLESPHGQPVTARLAAAASRRADLESLLGAAPPDAAPEQLRRLVVEQNVAGKGSAISRQKLWHQLKERYLLDRSVSEAAAFLAGFGATSSPSDGGLLCLLMMARTDRLFREVTLRAVSPSLTRDGVPVLADQVQQVLEAYLQEHGLVWSRDTMEHVRQHMLASLKDFGVLRGSKFKRTARPRPGSQVTLLAARLALLEGLTPRQVLDSQWFRLLGLDTGQVVDLLYATARDGVLRFRMQAEVVELEVPDPIVGET